MKHITPSEFADLLYFRFHLVEGLDLSKSQKDQMISEFEKYEHAIPEIDIAEAWF